jgi:hypothetical protein
LPPVPRQTPCIATDHSATTAAYKAGCSCEPARLAWRDRATEYNRRRRDPGYRGTRGGGPVLPMTPSERAQRAEALRERNLALAVGASRRLRSLLRIQHSREYLARRLGMSPGRISAISAGTSSGGIWPKTAMAIKSLHQELQYRKGTSQRTGDEAARLQYLPPAAWHPDDIDDPRAGPTWPYRKLTESRSATA